MVYAVQICPGSHWKEHNTLGLVSVMRSRWAVFRYCNWTYA